jgi:WD40 repeat protein
VGVPLSGASTARKARDIHAVGALRPYHLRCVFTNLIDLGLSGGGEDQVVKLWEPLSGRELRTLRGHSSAVQDVTFSPDVRLLATIAEHEIKIWESISGHDLRILPTLSDVSLSSSSGHVLAFSPGGKLLASGRGEHAIQIWDVVSGQLVRSLDIVGLLFIASIAFSQDGRILASGAKGVIQFFDAKTGNLIHSVNDGVGATDQIVAFSPDARILASGGAGYSAKENRINLLDVASGRIIRVLPTSTHGADETMFGQQVAIGLGGVLRTTIRVVDAALRRPSFSDSRLQCRNSNAGVDRATNRVADDTA